MIVLYPTEAIDAARLKEIKLLPSCGCDEVMRITFTDSFLNLRNKLLLRFLKDSVTEDPGNSYTTESFWYELLYIILNMDLPSKCSTSRTDVIFSLKNFLRIIKVVGNIIPRNTAIIQFSFVLGERILLAVSLAGSRIS